MKGKLLTGLIAAAALSACSFKVDSLTESISVTLTSSRLGYSYEQMLIPAISEARIITDIYTDAIWGSIIDKEKGITYRDNFFNDLRNFYKEIVVFREIADSNNITLTEQEKARAKRLSETFFNESAAVLPKLSNITKEECDEVFLDFVLVKKTKEELISENVKEVSESEARVMSFHVIEVSDYELANTLLVKLTEGENCAKLAARYSESDNVLRSLAVNEETDEVKNMLAVLEDGGVSPVIEDGGKYTLFKCVKSCDEEATKRNKEKIRKQRESEYLLGLYNSFFEKGSVDIGNADFERVCEDAFIHFDGQDFFSLLSED